MPKLLRLALFLSVLLCFSSCSFFSSGQYSLTDLEKDIRKYSNDKNISENDFKALLDEVRNSDNAKLKRFEEPEELLKYINKYLKTTKRHADVWSPASKDVLKPFNVNVFLENSASMDGYVTGVTEFESTIYEMLGNIRTSDVCDSLNLYFINSKIHAIKKKALAPDIKDFIADIEPDKFKQSGGDWTSSDLAEVIKKALSQSNKDNASILISDFVFSPGRNAVAKQYLDNQRVTIKINVTEKSKQQDLAVAVYQLKTSFKGEYFDLNNKPLRLTGVRPYYIWIIGTEAQVEALLEKQIINNSHPDLLNKLIFKKIKEEETDYKVVRNAKSGDFRSDGRNVSKATSENGTFAFSIAVNFGKNLRSDSYFTDPANYKLSNTDYRISGRVLSEKERSTPAMEGFTHLLTLTTTKLVNEDVKIALLARTPSWVDDYSSNDDTNIQNDLSEQSKTFGLKYLIGGVSEGFSINPNAQKNVITEFEINIKK